MLQDIITYPSHHLQSGYWFTAYWFLSPLLYCEVGSKVWLVIPGDPGDEHFHRVLSRSEAGCGLHIRSDRDLI